LPNYTKTYKKQAPNYPERTAQVLSTSQEGQDKRIEIFILLFWAHPCACGAWTGLSALIFFAGKTRKKIYRFNPLRVPCGYLFFLNGSGKTDKALQTIWWKRGKSGRVEAWKLQQASFMKIL
jgi:hypothetical protein